METSKSAVIAELCEHKHMTPVPGRAAIVLISIDSAFETCG